MSRVHWNKTLDLIHRKYRDQCTRNAKWKLYYLVVTINVHQIPSMCAKEIHPLSSSYRIQRQLQVSSLNYDHCFYFMYRLSPVAEVVKTLF